MNTKDTEDKRKVENIFIKYVYKYNQRNNQADY